MTTGERTTKWQVVKEQEDGEPDIYLFTKDGGQTGWNSRDSEAVLSLLNALEARVEAAERARAFQDELIEEHMKACAMPNRAAEVIRAEGA